MRLLWSMRVVGEWHALAVAVWADIYHGDTIVLMNSVKKVGLSAISSLLQMYLVGIAESSGHP
jgi:hypothetical protein